MRLKYLTLCLMGLSLSACSHHVIKTNTASTNLEQKAINSINAMYEYPSYDYRGKFNIHVEPSQQHSNATAENAVLDTALKQKVDQYLRDQKVNLNSKQKQALYVALAQEQKSSVQTKVDKFTQIMANVLNDMQFEYDGSVHYRQKMGSFNLTARYEKPTLLVQAKIPMVVDLNNYKFYINYFALMPYLVNKDSQNNLAYLDFSKYQDMFKQVDYKKFAEYVKASGAVYYRLADQKNIQSLSVSSADQAAGVVEKIRLKSSIEELILQANLYSKVNEKYFMQSVLNIKEENLEKLIANEVDAASKSGKTASLLDKKDSADDASVVSQELYRLVNQHFGVEDAEEDYADESADAAEDATQAAQRAYAEAAADSTVDATVAEDEQAGLTEEQCTALQNTPKNTYGDAQYCQSMYDIDVFGEQKAESGFLSYITKLQAVEKQFAAYDQSQFIDDQAFKALWIKHQADIEKALPPVEKRNPFVMDVGLDAQGRAVKLDYDLNYSLSELKSRFSVKADMLISNYGKATPIDQAQLKRAKSWSEASKGSMLEQAVNSFSEKLGQAGVQERSAEPYTMTLEDQLKVIAEQRYDATHAYDQTYKAVFIAKLTESAPQIVQRSSSQELQEIATVYAYWYANEEVYNPKGKALQSIEALQKKHHLENEDQFDDKLGQAVNRIVLDAMRGDTDRQAWKKLQAQYKQPQQLFAKQYQIQFEQENGASSEEKVLLGQTANILGQVYVDARKNKLSEKSIQSLKIEHNEFIDYEIFKEVYQKMLTVK
ncbi:hypothetical protein MN869_12080 [Acinetobacter sp. NIPH1876]|uniref:hypothetical protein n=1 Tax=unclassified Acinetobacter TaxID=196816 RepID=UPI001FAC1A3D|nr:hypothetical protein [Acinetobacter sp. NIPH1876]MCJ0829181.1 hypothetical protein [Acinetobacter sp. NIPH1876]